MIAKILPLLMFVALGFSSALVAAPGQAPASNFNFHQVDARIDRGTRPTVDEL